MTTPKQSTAKIFASHASYGKSKQRFTPYTASAFGGDKQIIVTIRYEFVSRYGVDQLGHVEKINVVVS